MGEYYDAIEGDLEPGERVVVPDYYKELGIPRGATRMECDKLLQKLIKKAKTPKQKAYLEAARDYLVEDRKRYDKRLKEQEKEKKRKKFKVFRNPKGFRNAIIIGTVAAISLTSASVYVNKKEEENTNSNVCVVYEIQAGDTKNELEEVYGLKDIYFVHYEISGFQRQQAAGGDTSGFLAVEDMIIARTTLENAEKFVEEEGAQIITIEEALERSETSSLSGEFKKYAEGDSTFVFYVPTNQKTIG